ncbi:MAG: oligosaccharide flippase family protein [Thermoplasmatota archaeon]
MLSDTGRSSKVPIMEKGDDTSNPLFTSITRKTLLVMVNFVIMGLIGIISWKFVATSMPQESVGIVHFALGFIGVFSFITNLGFGSSHVKRISEGQDLGRCIGTFMAIQLGLSVVFTLTVFLSLFFWKEIIGKGFETPAHERIIYLMLLYFISNNLATVATQTFAAKVEIAKNQFTVLMGALVQLGATIIIVLSTNSAYWFAMSFVIGAFFNFAISFSLLSKYPIKMPTLGLFKSYFFFAFPIFIVSALGTIPPNIDKIMIQLFWDAHEVAIYTGGQKFSFYIINIAAGLGMILFPIFSSLNANRKDDEIKDLVLRSERLMAILIAPISALLFSLAIPVVTLLGDTDYRASYLVLQPLAIWGFLRAMISPYRNLIMGIGKPKVLAIISIVSVVSIVLFNFIFIPMDISMLGIDMLGMGAMGAAIATLLSAALSSILFRIFAYRYAKVFFNPQIFKPLLISGVMAGAILGLQLLIPADGWVSFIIYGLVGSAFYFAAMMVLKGFTKEDRELLFNTINPLLMLKYIKEEFFPR